MLIWSTPRFEADEETRPVAVRKWYVFVLQAVLSTKVSGNVAVACVAFVALMVAVLICVFDGHADCIAALLTVKDSVRVAVAPGASVPRFVQTMPLFGAAAVASAPAPPPPRKPIVGALV